MLRQRFIIFPDNLARLLIGNRFSNPVSLVVNLKVAVSPCPGFTEKLLAGFFLNDGFFLTDSFQLIGNMVTHEIFSAGAGINVTPTAPGFPLGHSIRLDTIRPGGSHFHSKVSLPAFRTFSMVRPSVKAENF